MPGSKVEIELAEDSELENLNATNWYPVYSLIGQAIKDSIKDVFGMEETRFLSRKKTKRMEQRMQIMQDFDDMLEMHLNALRPEFRQSISAQILSSLRFTDGSFEHSGKYIHLTVQYRNIDLEDLFSYIHHPYCHLFFRVYKNRNKIMSQQAEHTIPMVSEFTRINNESEIIEPFWLLKEKNKNEKKKLCIRL